MIVVRLASGREVPITPPKKKEKIREPVRSGQDMCFQGKKVFVLGA